MEESEEPVKTFSFCVSIGSFVPGWRDERFLGWSPQRLVLGALSFFGLAKRDLGVPQILGPDSHPGLADEIRGICLGSFINDFFGSCYSFPNLFDKLGLAAL